MGVYNPNLPQILGQEWVPIRDEKIIYSGSLDNMELGHVFRPTASRTLTNGKFYIHEYPDSFYRDRFMSVNVYPTGQEDRSGPIRTVVIPCNNGGITGTGVSYQGGATSIPDIALNPSDGKYLRVAMGNGNAANASFFFAVNQYAPLLMNKRILGVNILYSIFNSVAAAEDAATLEFIPYVRSSAVFTGNWRYPAWVSGTTASLSSASTTLPNQVNRMQLGDVNYFFGPNNGFYDSVGSSGFDAHPWTFPELARFEASASQRLWVEGQSIGASGVGAVFLIDYVAMEVVYCEETRVAAGTAVFGYGSSGVNPIILGANQVTMRSISTMSVSPVLSQGQDYTVTLAENNAGDHLKTFTAVFRPEPAINGLRELYQISSHPGVKVTIPAPPDPDINGQTFTAEETHILPQLSLHTSAGPLTEVHAYGRQAQAQVWGTVTATQEVYDAGLSAATYPWIRFYARRFGETTVPLTVDSPTLTTATVSITPTEFDGLEEILDGWKEVTLRFPIPPTMGTGTNPQWRWSATGEQAGNRWEVLGAIAPALSGTPGNLMTLVPPPNQMSISTYGQPLSGAGVNLGWINQYAPPVSGTSDDQTSDAALLFSQDPFAVSGFGVTQQTQTLTGIGLGCDGTAPDYIPTGMFYNRLAWSYNQGITLADVFDRTVASGWGTATDGHVWGTAGGAANFAVNGGEGKVTLSVAGSFFRTDSTFSGTDFDGYVELSSNTLASTIDHWGSVYVRDTGTGVNQLFAMIAFNTNNTVSLSLVTRTASVNTTLATTQFASTYTVNEKISLRFKVSGTLFQAKAWKTATQDEPDDWTATAWTTANPGPGVVGTRSFLGGGGTPGMVLSYDNLQVSLANFGSYEIQRMDTVDTDWQTIMLATDPAQVVFNDYEARVGILTSYRIRSVNLYDFVGPWSSTVTNTITTPGVVGKLIGPDTYVLMFSSNERQSGAINLAYAQAFEGDVEENFSFPEAGFTQLQAMYDRDYFTAFRPLERGGDQFIRNILVQAAAIPPETLADFVSLRDMAWDTVPYVCVRDEDGNKWLATVVVPTGKVVHFRKLYMAEVRIIETTDTPSPVDP